MHLCSRCVSVSVDLPWPIIATRAVCGGAAGVCADVALMLRWESSQAQRIPVTAPFPPPFTPGCYCGARLPVNSDSGPAGEGSSFYRLIIANADNDQGQSWVVPVRRKDTNDYHFVFPARHQKPAVSLRHDAFNRPVGAAVLLLRLCGAVQWCKNGNGYAVLLCSAPRGTRSKIFRGFRFSSSGIRNQELGSRIANRGSRRVESAMPNEGTSHPDRLVAGLLYFADRNSSSGGA